jgi:hypothetical protein
MKEERTITVRQTRERIKDEQFVRDGRITGIVVAFT